MTGMLASVRNLKEAEMVCRGGTDIVDIKEPRHGALGAVPLICALHRCSLGKNA